MASRHRSWLRERARDIGKTRLPAELSALE
jgi:hypothetical protein